MLHWQVVLLLTFGGSGWFLPSLLVLVSRKLNLKVLFCTSFNIWVLSNNACALYIWIISASLNLHHQYWRLPSLGPIIDVSNPISIPIICLHFMHIVCKCTHYMQSVVHTDIVCPCIHTYACTHTYMYIEYLDLIAMQ